MIEMGILAWSVAAVGFAGGFVAALMARRQAGVPAFALPTLWLLSVLAFGLTLPTEPPPTFQPGGMLGWGILLTSGLWLISAFVATCKGWDWLGAALPLIAPVLALTFARGYSLPALWGISIATVLAWCLLRGVWGVVGSVALSVLSLTLMTGLALYAGAPRWYGVCVAGGAVVALWLIAWRSRQAPLGWWWAHVLTFGAFTLTALGYHLSGVEGRWLYLVLLALIAVTLARGLGGVGEWSRYALLVWVALFAGVFALQRGFGLASCALMVSLYAMVMAHERRVQTEPSERELYRVGAVLLTFLSAFRLFVLSYPLRPPRADLYTHYALVGFLLALVGLGVLALWWQRGERAPLMRVLMAGFWAAGLPLLLGALFGERATAGWLAGALAAALSAYLYSPDQPDSPPLTEWLYPLAFAGAAIALPLTELVVPYADLTRQTRMYIVTGAGGLLALSLLIAFLLERRVQRT